MPDTPPSSAAAPAAKPAAPAALAVPLKAVPKTRLPTAPAPRGVLAGLAPVAPAAKAARQKATGAAEIVRRTLASVNTSAAQVRAALDLHDASEANAAEFVREGVCVNCLRNYLSKAEALLDEFMPTADAAPKKGCCSKA